MRNEVSMLYTRETHASHRQNICGKMVISVLFIIGACVLHTSLGELSGDVLNNQTQLYDYGKGFEVPENFSLLLHRLPSENSTTLKPLARQNQEQNSSRRCSCTSGVCKCCTGYILDLLSQKACMKITYHPGDFAFDVAMSMNNRVLYENSISGKNPRPICINPPRMTNLKVCAKLYNVFFPGRNFHFCLAMVGQWHQTELFNIAFDCLRMGANGIAMVKPSENGGLEIPNPQGGVDAVIDAGDDEIEEYDENVVRSLLDELFDR